MRLFGVASIAGAVLAIEGVALIVIVVIELLAMRGGDASSFASGLALIVLTLIGVAALLAFSVGVLRRASWARSGGIVFQVLGIALALAALSVQPTPWTFVLSIGVLGVVGLVSLIATERRDGVADPRLEQRRAPDDEV